MKWAANLTNHKAGGVVAKREGPILKWAGL